MTDNDEHGFLSRWSRRKARARAADVAPEVASDEASPPPIPVAPAADEEAVDAIEPSAVLPPAAEIAPPTLDDVERLTPDADFSPFVDRLVQPEVRNAAMKKLFTDPHFNVMDGLDVYIDDYNKTEPMPRQWLRQLVQARVLGLLDDEVEEQPRPDTHTVQPPSSGEVGEVGEADEVDEAERVNEAEAAGEADVVDTAHEPACAAPAPDTPRPHEDTDLPLQQDDAAGHSGARAAADDDADSAGRG